VSKAKSSNLVGPLFSKPQQRQPSFLLVRNEGSRSLQIIGDLGADGCKVMPGSLFEIDIAALSGPVQLTVCDGAIQVDCAGGDLLAIEGEGAGTL